MMVSNRPSLLGLLGWQWKNCLFFTAAGALAPVLHLGPGWTHLTLPTTPLAVVGGAIGIFVSFRTNSCYARWWEGRQLWGRLINLSRDFAASSLAMLPKETAQQAIQLQIAYVHALRCALRDQAPLEDEDVARFTKEDERAQWKGHSNVTFAMQQRLRQIITRAADEGHTTEQRLQIFDRLLSGFLDVQGGCERIKRTPFPKGYAFIAEWLIFAFALLMPFAIVKDLGWITIPLTTLVSLSFALIGEAGRVLEDPFTLFWNALPLSALSKTIEINLRHATGETDVPRLPQPDARGILM